MTATLTFTTALAVSLWVIAPGMKRAAETLPNRGAGDKPNKRPVF